jgi:hypothetical protein
MQIWPQLLVSLDAKTDHDQFEGSFVLGLGRLGTAISESKCTAAREVAEAWRLQVLEKVALKDNFFLKVSLSQGVKEMAAQRLVACQRQFPLIELQSPEELCS